tara:strand:+ start:2791 stop:3465 length:675 start_codon:yes stop_codon:yes gene_type:complete
MKKITITGSEGLLGKEITKFLQKKNKIYKLDLQLGHDLNDETFVKKWFKENRSNYLINCFAINDHVSKNKRKSNLFNFPLETFNEYLQTNVTTLFSVCREFARNNQKSGIINFSSTYGLVSPRPDMYEGSHKDIGYGVSKSAVINMSKYLAVHLAPDIRVNCVIPGGVEHRQKKKFVNEYSKHTPMKRMMKKNELNHLMEFLCSENSSYSTGSTFVIDGGFTSW